jgi:hypothetical protein
MYVCIRGGSFSHGQTGLTVLWNPPVDHPHHPQQHQPQGKAAYFTQFPAMRYTPAVARKVGVLSLVFVGMVTFNNLCLKFVEVSVKNLSVCGNRGSFWGVRKACVVKESTQHINT